MFGILIQRERTQNIINLSTFALILYFVFPAIAIIPLILSIFVLNFFRNSVRRTAVIENLVVNVFVHKITELVSKKRVYWFEKIDICVDGTAIIGVVK